MAIGNNTASTISAPPRPSPPIIYSSNGSDFATWLAIRFLAILITGSAMYLAVRWPQLIERLNALLFSAGRRTEDVFKHLTRPKFQPTAEELDKSSSLISLLSSTEKFGRAISLQKIETDLSSRDRLLTALHGYIMYEKRSLASLDYKRKAWGKVSEQQKCLTAKSAVNYPAKLAKVERLIKTNSRTCLEIVAHGLSYYGISKEELDWYISIKEQEGIASGDALNAGSDHSTVCQALGHFVRDWSDAGICERDVTFQRILKCLELLVPDVGKRRTMKVLIPGCGVGGLVWKVAEMGFGNAIGNEWSYYMNLLQHFIGSRLSESKGEQNGGAQESRWQHKENHILYPYLECWSHQINNDNMARSISFPYPDSPLEKREELAPRISSIEEDFTQLRCLTSEKSEVESSVDILITLFFIDTARNMLDYLQKIHMCLKPHGIWINLGPLLYGTAPWVEFSLSEVISISEKGLGFEFEKLLDGGKWEEVWKGTTGEEVYDTLKEGKVVGVRAGYGIDEMGLGKNEYLAQGWVARKIK